MGINDRKEREKEELRTRILTAALEIYQEHGYEKTSIRAIADRIEYSPTTIYLYFKDKNDLLHAVHTEGFRLMADHFAPIANIQDPFERLLEMGKYYLQFAFGNPTLYDLMFVQTAPFEHLDQEDADWVQGQNSFKFLVDNVQACIDQGIMRKDNNAEVIAFTIWAAVHGIATLMMVRDCKKILSPELQPVIDVLAYEQLSALLKSYRVS